MAQLGRAIGFIAMVVALCSATGPSVGAAVLALADWPTVFLVHLPVGLAALIFGARVLPDVPRQPRIFDLGAAAMTSLKLVMNPPSAIFILTTNNLDKIDPGVRSRSHMIPMTVPPPNAWLLRCHAVLQNHGIQKMPSDDTLLPFIASCGGDARNIMDHMDALALEMQAAGVK
jgi:hypothetical protein